MTTFYKRILILLPRQLGDVLLGTPLAQVLKQQVPNVQVDWWAHPMAQQILEHNPHIHQIFYYPIWKEIKKERGKKFYIIPFLFLKFIFLSLFFVFKVRAQKYDVVIDALNIPRTALQTFLTAAPLRISFTTRAYRNIVYTHLVPRRTLSEGYLGHSRLALLEPLGIVVSPQQRLLLYPTLPFEQFFHKGASCAVIQWLENFQKISPFLQKLKSRRFSPVFDYVVLSPTHRRLLRRWPQEHFVRLAFEIISRFHLPVVWLWGPASEEQDLVLEAHSHLQNLLKSHNLNPYLSCVPPLFSLREAGVLSKYSSLWIGNSNGLSHVAVAAQARTLEIHGPTWSENWCHPHTQKHKFVQRQTGCVRCSRKSCKRPYRECLFDLSVQEVFSQVEQFLK